MMTQSENDSWFKCQKWRITSLVFKDVVNKISDKKVRNPKKCRKTTTKICGSATNFSSEATL